MASKFQHRSRPIGRAGSFGLTLALVAALGGCGGGGDSGGAASPPIAVTPPPPSPSPPPPPPPPAFASVLGRIFPNETVSAPLAVLGGGFQADFANSGSSLSSTNIRAVGPGTASYGGSSSGWTFDMPLLGRGTLFQSSEVRRSPGDLFDGTYSGRLSPTGLLADLKTSGSVDLFSPALAGGVYRDVSWLTYYDSAPLDTATTTYVNGVMGLARPTPGSAIPGTGQRTFASSLIGVAAGDAAGLVDATGSLQADFAVGSLTGSYDVAIACFMGCSYPIQRYKLASATFDRTTGRFTGTAEGPGGRTGSFVALLAGPDAREILLHLTFDYLNPELGKVVRTDAVVIGRVG